MHSPPIPRSTFFGFSSSLYAFDRAKISTGGAASTILNRDIFERIFRDNFLLVHFFNRTNANVTFRSCQSVGDKSVVEGLYCHLAGVQSLTQGCNRQAGKHMRYILGRIQASMPLIQWHPSIFSVDSKVSSLLAISNKSIPY